MSALTLVIGNKNYSSWSLRPWLFMRKNKLDFKEQIVWLDSPTFKTEVAPFGSNGTVPALLDGDLQIWDSMAIIDYLISTQSLSFNWPQHKACYALARSMSAEMHSGYAALRAHLSMDTRLKTPYQVQDVALQNDIDRINYLWSKALGSHNKKGNWLFGEFSAVDAMFAPVVFRFDSYSIKVSKSIRTYMDTVLSDEDVMAWVEAARDEVVLENH